MRLMLEPVISTRRLHLLCDRRADDADQGNEMGQFF